MKVRISWLAAAIIAATPVVAQVDLDQAQACFAEAAQGQGDALACIDAAQDACMDNAQETPAVATLCFNEAQGAWSQALGARIQQLTTNADDTLAAVIRIETKYDLLGQLMQCDRVEALSVAASGLSGPMIALQKARCQSTASALTYLQLIQRARALP